MLGTRKQLFRPIESIGIFLIVLSKYYFSTFFGFFCFEIVADAGAGVGIDEWVPINCPKAAPPSYEYLVVTIYPFNNGDQKITTNPNG